MANSSKSTRTDVAVSSSRTSDPGVPNWLDTGGEREGMIQYRWIWTKTDPVPALRRVAIDGVRAALPVDTPVVTPEQRREQVRIRQEHVRRRYRL